MATSVSPQLQKYVDLIDKARSDASAIAANDPNQPRFNPGLAFDPYKYFTPSDYSDYQRVNALNSKELQNEFDKYSNRSSWMGDLGALGFTVAGSLAGVPTLGAMMAGATKGLSSSPSAGFDEMLKGGATGAAMGYAGGQIAEGLGGYNPTGADAIWSESATPLSSFGATTASNAATGAAKGALGSAMQGGNPLQGAVSGGVSGGISSGINAGSNELGLPSGGLFDWAKGGLGKYATGSVLSNLFGNDASKPSGTQSSNIFGGGNMADNSVSDWAKSLAPFVGAYTANQQRGATGDTFGKAYELMTTPSAEQQKYRTQLGTLMDRPGSMESSPVYQAMLDQGMNAVNRTSAAKGMLGSGNRLADLMKMGQSTASQYYFPQQQALANLSGIQGDSAQRALGAGSLIQGQNAQNEMQTGMLKELMKGFGVSTPQDQLLAAMTGGGGASSSPNLIDMLKKTFGGGASGQGGGAEAYNPDWFNGINTNSIMYGGDPYGPSSLPDSTSGLDIGGYLSNPDYTQSQFQVDPNWFNQG